MKKIIIFAAFLGAALLHVGCTLTGFAIRCKPGLGCEMKIDSVQIYRCDTCSQSYVNN